MSYLTQKIDFGSIGSFFNSADFSLNKTFPENLPAKTFIDKVVLNAFLGPTSTDSLTSKHLEFEAGKIFFRAKQLKS